MVEMIAPKTADAPCREPARAPRHEGGAARAVRRPLPPLPRVAPGANLCLCGGSRRTNLTCLAASCGQPSAPTTFSRAHRTSSSGPKSTACSIWTAWCRISMAGCRPWPRTSMRPDRSSVARPEGHQAGLLAHPHRQRTRPGAVGAHAVRARGGWSGSRATHRYYITRQPSVLRRASFGAGPDRGGIAVARHRTRCAYCHPLV